MTTVRQLWHSFLGVRATLTRASFLLASTLFATAGALAEGDLIFERCAFEADRYVVCRIAPPEIESYIKSQRGVHPGAAFAAFIKNYFEQRGCDYKVGDEAFRLNGVFFSLDSRAFTAISCDGAPLKPKFAPDAMSITGATFKMSD